MAYETCDKCGGSGRSGSCYSCRGTGVTVIFGTEYTCSDCDGTGQETCQYCYGSGSIEIDEGESREKRSSTWFW